MKLIVNLAVLLASGILLTSCGSGSGDEAVPPTVRPKTMDGLVFTVGNNLSFEFVRGVGSPPALLSGDIETGTFFYTSGGTRWAQPPLPNLIGTQTSVLYPSNLTAATYTYRAINTNQAVLILTGIGDARLPIQGEPGTTNGSSMQLFIQDSDGNVNNTVTFDISFATNGATISLEPSTMFQPGSESSFDRVRVETNTIRLASGGPVPENYNPEFDPLRPSRIAPESLGGKRIDFTNTGFGDPAFNFSIQFTRVDRETFSDQQQREIGTGLLRIADAVRDDAIDYTWRRIPGTDSGRLVVSRSATTFDGGYTLDFFAPEQGTYIGELDGDTTDIDEVIGTFIVN